MEKLMRLLLVICLAGAVVALVEASPALDTPGSTAVPSPSKTGVPPPNQTATSTPVDEDFLPLVWREGDTPTPTATLDPRITPTADPTRTPVPEP
jgi:hypothetical protein